MTNSKPKPTSREIIEHLLTKQKYVPCYVSRVLKNPDTAGILSFIRYVDTDTGGYCGNGSINWKYATPFDIVTGEIITEIDDD